MGKKSKSNTKAAPNAAKTNTAPKKDLPGWHDALEKATIENVKELTQYEHGWIATLIRTETTNKTHPHGILAILDITNRVNGEGMDPRYMNIGPCPNPHSATGAEEIAKALLATMIQPSKGPPHDIPLYFEPRRPAWILLEKELTHALEIVATTLAEVNVAVQINGAAAGAAGQNTQDESIAEDSRGRLATWDAGLAIGATVENVSKIPRDVGSVWKCSMTMLEDPDTGAKESFLAIEEITNRKETSSETANEDEDDGSYPLGVGPCPAITVNPNGVVRSLFATMLSPRAKEGGYGEARRPQTIVLDKPLEPWLELMQYKMKFANISVRM